MNLLLQATKVVDVKQSDVLQIYLALIATCVPIATLIMGYMASRAARRDKLEDERAREIKESTDSIKRTGEQNHTLLNGGMLLQKQLYMLAMMRVARENPDNADDQEAARLAKKYYDEHAKLQSQLNDTDAARAEGNVEGRAEEKSEEKSRRNT